MTSDYILTVFITIVTIVDPLGLIPVYLPIAERFPKKQHKQLILLSFSIAVTISTCFLFVGKYLFKYLEVHYNSIYIVGGILLFMIGLDMIYARPRRTKSSPEEQEEAMSSELKEVAVFPLAIPLLSGPGTIACLIMFSSRHNTVENYAVIFGAMLLALTIAAVAMLFSNKLLLIFGQTGLNVLDRVMGLILCALAVQFITNAVVAIARTI